MLGTVCQWQFFCQIVKLLYHCEWPHHLISHLFLSDRQVTSISVISVYPGLSLRALNRNTCYGNLLTSLLWVWSSRYQVTQNLMTALYTESLVTQTWSCIPVNNKLMNGFWHPAGVGIWQFYNLHNLAVTVSYISLFLHLFIFILFSLRCPRFSMHKCWKNSNTRPSIYVFLRTVPPFVTAHTFCASWYMYIQIS